MNKLRLFPFAIIGFNLLLSLVVLAAKGPQSGIGGFLAMNVVLLAVAALSFGLQSRSARKGMNQSEQTIRALASTAFDSPAEIRAKFESSLTGAASVLGPGGALSPAKGFTAIGKVKGITTKIASGTSMIARENFELSHTYSYVSLDAGNSAGRFAFIAREGAAKWGNLFGHLPDHKMGDDAFDAQWVVTGDPDIARDVIDERLRRQLTALQQRAAAVSNVGMSIELTGEGLVVRWPGQLDGALGIELRDLALTLRERLLGYLRRNGLIDEPASVRVDVAPPRAAATAEEVPVENETGTRAGEAG